ncbi:hypothetical protein CDAR_378861 [Caerostris darwini]|uniref:Uncharacterized protein n=1 Tax=Caerostris darwini TaxID=1538125 RepID=A0AAV4TZ71_9ARAC|nr:hypothetical protein CDAR_378861 [Caerostris darwini]
MGSRRGFFLGGIKMRGRRSIYCPQGGRGQMTHRRRVMNEPSANNMTSFVRRAHVMETVNYPITNRTEDISMFPNIRQKRNGSAQGGIAKSKKPWQNQ